ncbi:Glycosyltransferase AglD [uncultured archaeon]|nr:Glycosyltransferase AglD [uncultured archaeon]
MPELSIIIPAYNEEKRIRNTLDEYVDFFSARYGNNYELLVMTDGCTDNTVPIVKQYCSCHPQVFNYHYEGRRGKGGAIIEGFRNARGEVIACADADGSINAEWLYSLLTNLNGDDGVIASRYMDGAEIAVKQPVARRIASRAFNVLVRSLFGLSYRDTQCGGKILRTHAAKSIAGSIITTNFAFDIDMLYQLNRRGFKIREVPVKWDDKKGSSVKLFRTSITMFLAVFRLRIVNSPFVLLIQLGQRISDSLPSSVGDARTHQNSNPEFKAQSIIKPTIKHHAVSYKERKEDLADFKSARKKKTLPANNI